MFKLLEYFSRFEALRGRIITLPGWSRGLIFIAALPGVVLIALSILALLVSIFVLLLLTVPLYRVLQALLRSADDQQVGPPGVVFPDDLTSPGRKKVEVTIIE
jgi:hypothetical protein